MGTVCYAGFTDMQFVASIVKAVQHKVNRQQDNYIKCPFREQTQGPEKRYPVQESQEQGRIPHRCKCPTDIAYQEMSRVYTIEVTEGSIIKNLKKLWMDNPSNLEAYNNYYEALMDYIDGSVNVDAI